MGTPEFAVGPLQALVEGGYKVVAVVTAPDKPAGRGMQLQQSAVKQYAVNQNITVLQPVKLRDEGFLAELKALEADLFIVVAFRMLPEIVWAMPRLGTFNLHASLLPNYRGAAPINWAIINGDTETGVTTFFINEEIDAGKILLQEKVPILASDNAETLHDKLKSLGSTLVLKTVDGIINNSISAISQNETYDINKFSTAPKLFKENTRLDWQKTARRLVDFVRGLSPYPAAWCELTVDGNPVAVKIFAAHAEEENAGQNCHSGLEPESQPKDCHCGLDPQSPDMRMANQVRDDNFKNEIPAQGRNDKEKACVLTNGSSFLKIRCADGYLCVDELQLTGKKRMKTEDFLRGFRGKFE